jgi:hypothetical protein
LKKLLLVTYHEDGLVECLTNFVTIRKAVKKMSMIDRMKKIGTFNDIRDASGSIYVLN